LQQPQKCLVQRKLCPNFSRKWVIEKFPLLPNFEKNMLAATTKMPCAAEAMPKFFQKMGDRKISSFAKF